MTLFRQILTLLQLMFQVPTSQAGRTSIPTLANAITGTGAAGAWAYGAYVTLIATGDTTKNFMVVDLMCEAFVAGAIYQIDIATGVAAAEVVRATIHVGPALVRHPVGLGPYPAGTTVRFRVASKAGGAQAVDFSSSIIYTV